MPVTVKFAEFIKEQLGGLGEISVRRMFGGVGVYCNGLIFGLLSDDTLYFRVDDANRAAFEAEALQPLRYETDGRTIQLPYWRAPERLLDEPDEMLAWAGEALAAAGRVAAKRKGKKER